MSATWSRFAAISTGPVAPEPTRGGPAAAAIAARRVRWQKANRVIPTRYPAISLFDRVAGPEDFEALYALESMTNERLREQLGQVDNVAREDRIYGAGSGPIMAAFTHVNAFGSRFADGTWGVFYAARERETSIVETKHHHARFLAATREAPMHLPMRLYQVAIDARLHDLRPPAAVDPAVLSPDDYTASRRLGRTLRDAGSDGVAYPSVRHQGGECVGLFRPRGASRCLHAAYLLYAWDGECFSDVYEKLD